MVKKKRKRFSVKKFGRDLVANSKFGSIGSILPSKAKELLNKA